MQNLHNYENIFYLVKPAYGKDALKYQSYHLKNAINTARNTASKSGEPFEIHRVCRTVIDGNETISSTLLMVVGS